PDRRCQSFGSGGASVFLHRTQLSGGAYVHQLGGSEPAGAPVVRQGQLDLQEAYPRGAARTVRSGAHASQTAAGVDSGSVSSASANGGRGRLRFGELHSLLGASRLDRASGGGARDTGQDRDRNGRAPHRHACACGDASVAARHAGRASAAAWGRSQTRSAPGGKGDRRSRAGDRTLRGGAEAEEPQGGGPCPAATVATAAGISARTVPGRGAGSRPIWPLRSRPFGANDFAPRGARLLSTAGSGHRFP